MRGDGQELRAVLGAEARPIPKQVDRALLHQVHGVDAVPHLHHIDAVGSPVRHQVAGVVAIQIPPAPQQVADLEIFLHPQVPVM